MTPLIDIIFLLLLFFMLSSTFSRFAEVELQLGGTGGATETAPERLRFLRITEAGLTLNGQPVEAEGLVQAVGAGGGDGDGAATVLVAVTDGASAQALTDVLVALRPVLDLTVSVLEAR